MSRKPEAVIIDIDGVLCHVPKGFGEEFNWATFREKDLNREVLSSGVELASMFINRGYYAIFLTARHENMRNQTISFLHSQGLTGTLITTSFGDDKQQQREDWQEVQALHKKAAVEALVEKFDIKYALDDQEPNSKMYREFNIPVLKAMFI